MLLALIIASGLFTLLIGGKTLLVGLTMLPVIGPTIGWYADLVQPLLASGITEQLICGGMAMQVIVMMLSIPLYLPGVVRRGIAAYRARTAAHS